MPCVCWTVQKSRIHMKNMNAMILQTVSRPQTNLDMTTNWSKTLVTTGKTGNHYVFVIPIEAEIDFKKAAKVVGEKSLEMLHLKDLTKVTGYVRGGCTAIGMKKQFPTVIQEDAKELEYMHVSGGKLGMQIRLAPLDLQKVAKAEFADVIRP